MGLTLIHAKQELESARRCLTALNESKTIDEVDAYWVAFLRHLDRSYYKALAQLKKYPKYQGWTARGRVESLRKGDDPLLAYLHFARGAEEHGIDPISEKKYGHIAINPVVPSGLLYIRELSVNNDRVSVDSPMPFKVEIKAANLTLLDVVNRGTRYPIPELHIEKPLNGADPTTLARAGLQFYETFISDAESEFRRAYSE